MALGIDFSYVLVGFGRQVGLENRAKSEKKSIEKRIDKNDEKKLPFGSAWGV